MLIQMPPWVLIDGTFGALDNDVLELVMDVFTHELQRTAVIHVGSAGEAHDLFSKVLHLVKAPRTSALEGAQTDPVPASTPKESGTPQ
jgi:putative ATP-binding cassette transporter